MISVYIILCVFFITKYKSLVIFVRMRVVCMSYVSIRINSWIILIRRGHPCIQFLCVIWSGIATTSQRFDRRLYLGRNTRYTYTARNLNNITHHQLRTAQSSRRSLFVTCPVPVNFAHETIVSSELYVPAALLGRVTRSPYSHVGTLSCCSCKKANDRAEGPYPRIEKT